MVAHGIDERPEPFGLLDPVLCANQRQYSNKGFLRDIFDRFFGTQARTQFELDEFAEVGREMSFGARIAALQDGPSTTTRNLTTAIDPATFSQEADQTSEDQIGLDRRQRRDVQHRLTGLGFDTKANGRFDDETRAVIKRWQAVRGYPTTGYLNTLQHKALVGEIVSTRVASIDDSDDESAHHSRYGGGGRRYYRGGGPGGFFGHVMGGLFR